MSLPEPGRFDLNSMDGSSWPTYWSFGYSRASTHVECLLRHKGLLPRLAASALTAFVCAAAVLAPAALTGAASAAAARSGTLSKLSAASLDRFNLCPFAHQRSPGRGGIAPTDGHLDCPCRVAYLPGRSQRIAG